MRQIHHPLLFIKIICVVLDSRKIKRDGCYGAPDVSFEIISQSTRKTDYEEKQSVYLENGVKAVVALDELHCWRRDHCIGGAMGNVC